MSRDVIAAVTRAFLFKAPPLLPNTLDHFAAAVVLEKEMRGLIVDVSLGIVFLFLSSAIIEGESPYWMDLMVVFNGWMDEFNGWMDEFNGGCFLLLFFLSNLFI